MSDINEDLVQNISPEENQEEPKPEPIDCVVEVEVEGGGLSAKIRAHSPQFDGKDVTTEQVELALREQGVVYGIDPNAIESVVKEKKYDDWFVVAKCMPAVDGENGSVEYLFEAQVMGIPKQDSHGTVDYKDLGRVRNIKAGTVIANITKETEGNPGINVKNEAINPKAGNPPKVTFAENIEVSEDGLQVLASVDGNLSYKNGRFAVETVVKIDGDVDVSTGNIEFLGEVIVRGDVKEGFKVTSGKSITVQGGAFGAKLIATEKVVVKNGIIGSEVIAGASVEVDFSENSTINCHESLKAKTLYFCDVYCKGEVLVNMGNGSIIGGRVICTKDLFANVIGSRSNSLTQIVVGDNAIMLQERFKVVQKINQLDIEEDKCNKIVEYLMHKKEELGELPKERQDVATLAAKTILLSRNEKEQLTKRIEEIDVYLQTKQNLFVSCKKELYPGVKIIINDTVFTADTLYQHCTIGIGNDGIEVRPFA